MTGLKIAGEVVKFAQLSTASGRARTFFGGVAHKVLTFWRVARNRCPRAAGYGASRCVCDRQAGELRRRERERSNSQADLLKHDERGAIDLERPSACGLDDFTCQIKQSPAYRLHLMRMPHALQSNRFEQYKHMVRNHPEPKKHRVGNTIETPQRRCCSRQVCWR